MLETKPEDFTPQNTWYEEHGKAVFGSTKLLSYHTKPIQRDLIDAGAMAKVGNRIFLHKTRFWPEYQRIVSAGLEG